MIALCFGQVCIATTVRDGVAIANKGQAGSPHCQRTQSTTQCIIDISILLHINRYFRQLSAFAISPQHYTLQITMHIIVLFAFDLSRRNDASNVSSLIFSYDGSSSLQFCVIFTSSSTSVLPVTEDLYYSINTTWIIKYHTIPYVTMQ